MIAFIPNLSFMVEFLTFQKCQRRKLTLGIKPSLSTTASSKLLECRENKEKKISMFTQGISFLSSLAPPHSISQIDLLSSSCREPASPLVSKNQV